MEKLNFTGGNELSDWFVYIAGDICLFFFGVYLLRIQNACNIKLHNSQFLTCLLKK